MTKSLVMHEDQVREFYYNVKFNEDGSLQTLVGDKRMHLNEKLLEEILEVPREGIRFVAGKLYTQHSANECSKLPDMHRAGI
uniref:Putative ovule protein n=1 Tax=Solanum chacoense TaxID=4108 RepID=A0A0V0GS85_SOLCH